MLAAKSDWLDTSEDIHDVVSFYKTQLPTWGKLLEALAGFVDNREVLQRIRSAPLHWPIWNRSATTRRLMAEIPAHRRADQRPSKASMNPPPRSNVSVR